MNEYYEMLNSEIQRSCGEANVFCRKCGGTRMHVTGFSGCRCKTPEQSWARLTWAARLKKWIQPAANTPVVRKDGVVDYWVENRPGKPWLVSARTLSQMNAMVPNEYVVGVR